MARRGMRRARGVYSRGGSNAGTQQAWMLVLGILLCLTGVGIPFGILVIILSFVIK